MAMNPGIPDNVEIKVCVCGRSYTPGTGGVACHIPFIEWEGEPWRIADAQNDATHWHLTVTKVPQNTEDYTDLKKALKWRREGLAWR